MCAEIRYELDYEADNSLFSGNGYVLMDINVTGLCNVNKQLNLRETHRNGTMGCTIKTNGTRHITVRPPVTLCRLAFPTRPDFGVGVSRGSVCLSLEELGIRRG